MSDTNLQNTNFDSIDSALEDFALGKFLIVLDDEGRENEGDLIIAAQYMTTEKMAFLIRHTSGYVCCATTAERLDKLELPLLVPSSHLATDAFKTAFCMTVDLIEGTTTGISASDRSNTARALSDMSLTDPLKFSRPGHMVTLRGVEGGVLKRPGHTEAAIDLCRLSKLSLCGIICELVNDDGSMKRQNDCFQLASKHGIKIITIAQLISHISEMSE